MFSASEGSAGEIGSSFRQSRQTDQFKFRLKAALVRAFPVAADHNHFSVTNSGLRITYLIQNFLKLFHAWSTNSLLFKLRIKSCYS